ncbi:ATP-grasp domain-containing protein [Bdellovibrio sp. SKB1291214]|uniref:ATP-grasp domain-containing protein n=1 Tax=Bdellovibrio sp. SKB1291214 TaxID=1732569 RepID=UPI000B51D5C9|nr:ATP-grasp domain-containing protein [Bdellovibrio sp. SKB1291214]UYL07512.1 ATP-grasp domain-containing protein [Bdellovibrio sp. SKB1291214]
MNKIAVFFQSEAPPVVDGIKKPFKPGGYSDSGADIAFTLKKQGHEVVVPVPAPHAEADMDWVFPDTLQGFAKAYEAGARIFWLNTVLYVGHPVEKLKYPDVRFVGQLPSDVQTFDDKFATNKFLKQRKLPVASSDMVRLSDWKMIDFSSPKVIKPIRGRGSQGVEIVQDATGMSALVDRWRASGEFGDAVMVEEYLTGQEITITVMPPGSYNIDGKVVQKDLAWALPPVKRFNHQNGIAPYNGVVAVTANSTLLTEQEAATPAVRAAMAACERAGTLIENRALIRIDCRQNRAGEYLLFDLNMKPNMTGSGRPGRDDQDSLSGIAARGIGWDYKDLLEAMLSQSWQGIINSQGYLRK